MKAFKKPIPVNFRRLTGPEVIQTLEGPVSAGPEQVVITGIQGEEYPISLVAFERDYDYSESTGRCVKKKIKVTCMKLTVPYEVKVSWCEDVLKGKPGDYLVFYADGSQGIVEENIFHESYEVIE